MYNNRIKNNQISRHIGYNNRIKNNQISRHIGYNNRIKNNQISRHIGYNNRIKNNQISRHVDAKFCHYYQKVAIMVTLKTGDKFPYYVHIIISWQNW